uniref:Uncharacterized protein n=1 Tax=Helianthus annuus TaxID=4232 RepID=A0A251UNU4_HELAN
MLTSKHTLRPHSSIYLHTTTLARFLKWRHFPLWFPHHLWNPFKFNFSFCTSLQRRPSPIFLHHYHLRTRLIFGLNLHTSTTAAASI